MKIEKAYVSEDRNIYAILNKESNYERFVMTATEHYNKDLNEKQVVFMLLKDDSEELNISSMKEINIQRTRFKKSSKTEVDVIGIKISDKLYSTFIGYYKTSKGIIYDNKYVEVETVHTQDEMTTFLNNNAEDFIIKKQYRAISSYILEHKLSQIEVGDRSPKHDMEVRMSPNATGKPLYCYFSDDKYIALPCIDKKNEYDIFEITAYIHCKNNDIEFVRILEKVDNMKFDPKVFKIKKAYNGCNLKPIGEECTSYNKLSICEFSDNDTAVFLSTVDNGVLRGGVQIEIYATKEFNDSPEMIEYIVENILIPRNFTRMTATILGLENANIRHFKIPISGKANAPISFNDIEKQITDIMKQKKQD